MFSILAHVIFPKFIYMEKYNFIGGFLFLFYLKRLISCSLDEKNTETKTKTYIKTSFVKIIGITL
jgi:hypothetical protein